MKKRLSPLEFTELVTIDRGEENRFLSPRFGHLEKRGLIERAPSAKYGYRVTSDGRTAMRAWGYT